MTERQMIITAVETLGLEINTNCSAPRIIAKLEKIGKGEDDIYQILFDDFDFSNFDLEGKSFGELINLYAAKMTEKRSNVVKRRTPRKFEKDGTTVRSLVTDMIAAASHTRKDILAAVRNIFPEAKDSYVGTMLSDGKNPKYCKFDSLIVTDPETEILKFEA